MKKTIIALLLVAAYNPAFAQGIGPDNAVRDAVRFSNPHARDWADWVSTGLVAGSLVVPCIHDHTWKCLGKEGAQVGTVILSSELTKHFVHRTRPDHSDNKSFWSEHSAIACVATLNTAYWSICPSVMFLRIAADRHYLTDTLGGLAAAATVKVTVVW